MGGIAIALAKVGHDVTGSDKDVYEPMQGRLAREGIRVSAYAAEHVPGNADAIIVGTRVARENSELSFVRERGLSSESFPEFLANRFLRRSRNLVVAGGVGKTTTTAMLAWILEREGLQPDYLIGGLARNFPTSARFAGSDVSVIEGDEYAKRENDASPKFLHYFPEVVTITNSLVDHPDLYPDTNRLIEALRGLVRLLPAHGCLVLGNDEEGSATLAEAARCSVIRVGTDARADQVIGGVVLSSLGSAFELSGTRFQLPMHGLMNVRNASSAAVAALHLGVALERSALALSIFEGLADHQEAAEAGACTLVRDKASHPQSLIELSAALRQRYPKRRLVCVIQPRATGGRHWIYQKHLPRALSGFDKVILTRPYEHNPGPRTAWQDKPFSMDALISDLRSLRVDLDVAPELESLPAFVSQRTRPGDVVLLSLREQFGRVGVDIERALAGGELRCNSLA